MALSNQIAEFVRRSGWCEDKAYKVVAIQSTINGYHAHRVTPFAMSLLCTREHENRYSKNAILVSTPPVGELS